MKKGFYVTLNMKNTVIFTVSFILLISSCLLLSFGNRLVSAVKANSAVSPVIIIDAGHGGEDGGTQSADGILEKDINLSVSLKINDILIKEGFTTLLVRDGDYLIYDENSSSIREKKKSDIYNRMEIMEKTDNCIFLSVHQNYFTESKYSGAQVFYSKNDAESEKIASEIQQAIVSEIQPDNTRQIKASGKEIYLLYNAQAPAVMVECGFLSNNEEAKKLSDEAYQQKMAEAIVKGLKNYFLNAEKQSQGDNSNGSENKKYFRMQ